MNAPGNVIPFRTSKPADEPAPEPKKQGFSPGVALLVVGAVLAFAYVKRRAAEDKEREKLLELENQYEALEQKEAAMRSSSYDRAYRPWF
jgi:hypothetical protein